MSGDFGRRKPAPLPLEEARERVMGRLPGARTRTLPLAEAWGHVLAGDVKSDVDMPPFDKSAMDGYAVRASDTAGAPRTLRVGGSVAAGAMPAGALQPGEAWKIMTGAPLPPGADAVQMVERTRAAAEPGVVEILEGVAPGENVASRGEDMTRGSLVLAQGAHLGPAEIGLLAAVGQTDVKVFAAPRVAVLCTGDEIVPPDVTPAGAQIRSSNGPSLLAAAAWERCDTVDLGIVRDDPAALRERLAAGLEHDVLLCTGGVSMGEHDLVDRMLAELGVELHVESVAIKPGKPTVFGTHKGRGTLVFGLPGNPLSCLVAWTLLVAPAIRRMRRLPKPMPTRVRATVLGAVKGDRRRRCFVRGNLTLHQAGPQFEAVSFHGSADLPAYTRGNALLEIPEGRTRVESGETADVLLDDQFLRR